MEITVCSTYSSFQVKTYDLYGKSPRKIRDQIYPRTERHQSIPANFYRRSKGKLLNILDVHVALRINVTVA